MFMKRCKCCKSIKSLFLPKIEIEYLLLNVILANSAIAKHYAKQFKELCLDCAKDFAEKSHAEIRREYEERLTKESKVEE